MLTPHKPMSAETKTTTNKNKSKINSEPYRFLFISEKMNTLAIQNRTGFG